MLLEGDLAAILRMRTSDLERALLNLVENALRFSTDGEAVRVHVALERGLVHFRVSNVGVTIPEELQSRIFDRFFTTDSERRGTGLGLSIVQAIAEAHGGNVRLERSDGAKTIFALTIPAS